VNKNGGAVGPGAEGMDSGEGKMFVFRI